MSFKGLVISVVFLWAFVSGNRRFSMLLRDETLSRQKENSKLSKRLDAIERLLFMEDEMEEALMMIPEIIDNVRHLSTNMDSLNNIVNTALEQTDTKFVAITSTLEILGNRMKTIEDKLSHNNDAIIKDVKLKYMNMNKRLDRITMLAIGKHPSCLSLHESGQSENGVYDIYPAKDEVAVPVYCDMTTDGGGWAVFQRRQDGSVGFFRGWTAYKRGFGEVDGEFWLGNDVIAELTSDCCHELRVDMGDFDGNHRYAHYDSFKVSPESDKYKLAVGDYSGDAGDSLSYHNNRPFSTKDRENDEAASNCAIKYKGAWWYWVCHYSSLNGKYLRGAHNARSNGVIWHGWLGIEYSLKMTEMKLR